ncbi:Pentatricopeptide repeat-containing protein At1g66345, mitochondrial [Linum perenne]
MLHILVGARLFTDARALIESVLKRTHGSKFEVVDSLLDSYRVMISNPLVFNLLVQCYAKLRMHEIDLMWKVYERVISRRIYPDEATRTVVAGLCKQGKLQELVGILDKIQGKRCSNCSPLMIVNTGLILRILEEEEEEGRRRSWDGFVEINVAEEHDYRHSCLLLNRSCQGETRGLEFCRRGVRRNAQERIRR